MLLDKFNISVRIYKQVKEEPQAKGEFLGSGFFIDEKTIITCEHVVRDEKFVMIEIASLFRGAIKFEVVERSKAIDVAIIRLNPQVNIMDQYPPVIDINYSDIEGLQCSVYGMIDEHPNGAWTESIIGSPVKPYLIEAHQIGSGYSIKSGYSGSPVWLKDFKAIVGMVKAGGIFNFIGGQHLLNFLKIQGFKIDRIDSPRFTENYFRIDKFFNKVNDTLNKEHDKDSRLLVICGPSGIGKTSLTIDVYNSFEGNKVWIYAKIIDDIRVFENKTQSLKKSDLLIIEDVYENHPLITKGWLNQSLRCDIIITTTSRQLAALIKERNKHPDRKDFLYELASLSKEDSLAILSSNLGTSVSVDLMDKIITSTKGFPLYLKIINEILLSEIESQNTSNKTYITDNNSFLNSILNPILSEKELHEMIFKKWCDQSYIEEVHKDILIILSTVTNIGISTKALLYILNTDENDLHGAIQFLRKKGFISINISPDNQENIIVIHQTICKLITDIPKEKISNFETRYIKYLKTDIPDNNYEKGVVQKIDLLILKLRNLWEKRTQDTIDGNEFIRGLSDYSKELDKMLPQNSGSLAKSEWIAELFQPFVSKNCTAVIPVARVIRQLEKCEVLAEMIWQGVTNIYEDEPIPDALARTCVIVSAFAHWSKIKNINKDYILRKVHFHLDDLYRLYPNENNDKEVAVLIGGLCSIGLFKEAIEIVDSPKFKRQFKYTQFSYLMLAIGLLPDKNYHQTIQKIISNDLKNVYESEAKEDVIQYLKLKGFPINHFNVKSDIEYYRNSNGDILPGLSRLISVGCHSSDFDDFVVPKRGETTLV